MELDGLVSGVHDNEDVLRVRIAVSEGSDEELGGSGEGVDTLEAGQDEAREVSHVEVRGLEVDLLSCRESNDGGIAEAVEMVGSSLGIKNHVPVDPSSGPVVQISNNVQAVVLSTGPVVDEDTRAVASLSSEQEFVGSNLVRGGEVLELVTRIPVEGSSVGEIANRRVERSVEEGVDPISDVILVVIVDHDLNFRMVLLHDGRQVVLEMIKHISRAVDASLPGSGKLGLVLDGHSPEVDTLALVSVKVGGDVASISVVDIRVGQETEGLSRGVKSLVDLHPRRRGPRSSEHLDGVDSMTVSSLDEGQEMLTIGVNAEVAHVEISGSGGVGVTFDREIAASNVSTAQSIVVSGRSEVSLQDLLLKISIELGEDVATSVGECASKACRRSKKRRREDVRRATRAKYNRVSFPFRAR